ncbi:MAG: ubiquitin-like small modifier protein 1 [Acidimicrobiales bacterium]
MAVTVRIPTQLRPLAGGSSQVEVAGATVAEVLKGLDAAHPGFGERIFDESGTLRRFVNVFVADEDIRFQSGVDTPVPDGATVSIVPAVAGGCVSPLEAVNC